jgi:glycosyltransferase involved in cell wall biosynthesis
MAVLHGEFRNTRLEIAGCGPHRAEIEQEVNRLNLKDQVRFLGWRKDLKHTLRNWHIFAVLEAMSEGVAVVVSDVGGLPELVEDGRSGFLVPANNQSALAAKLRCLVREPRIRSSMGAAGRQRVVEEFSVERMVGKIRAVYDALI